MDINERFRVEHLHPVQVDKLRVQAKLHVRRKQMERQFALGFRFVFRQRGMAVFLRQFRFKFILA